MRQSRPFGPSGRACTVIGVQHEALLRSIGGNICNYCSKCGSAGCAWELAAPADEALARPGPAPIARPAGASLHRGPASRHSAAEVASHLGP